MIEFLERLGKIIMIFSEELGRLLLVLVRCYKGFYTSGGAEGVGKATIGAVVLSSMTILNENAKITGDFSNDEKNSKKPYVKAGLKHSIFKKFLYECRC